VYGAPISSGQPIAGIDTHPVFSEPVHRGGNASAAAESARVPGNDNVAGSSRPEFVDSSELEQLVSIEPVYPTAAMRDRVTGWVTLEFTVTPTGGVRDILVTDSEPYAVFDAAATKAVSQWRFTPRVSNGRAVAIRSGVTLHFDVDR